MKIPALLLSSTLIISAFVFPILALATTNEIEVGSFTQPLASVRNDFKQHSSLVRDDFNSYSLGSVVGQDGWTSYSNGQNYIVERGIAYDGRKALFNNIIGDSVITKSGSPLSDGQQTLFVRTQNRSAWGVYPDGNVQVRISKGQSFASSIFIAVSFKTDGNVAYYDPVADAYHNFATYKDNRWTELQIQWRASDKTARYRVNNGLWTSWLTFENAALFTSFDNVGFDFNLPSGSGGVYFDNLH